MPLKVEIEPEELVQKTTDSRGRLNLGSEWADQEVKLIIITDPNTDGEE